MRELCSTCRPSPPPHTETGERFRERPGEKGENKEGLPGDDNYGCELHRNCRQTTPPWVVFLHVHRLLPAIGDEGDLSAEATDNGEDDAASNEGKAIDGDIKGDTAI
ncbi:hypothetical protein E2562_019225 [Oryza meyeriana var. granulata]|uniref:Uncharacterized protein n=1 Tax=Oryza meyeriana var. granulata TaxID=110450 RepID=A0A6G1FAB0_9ORYZ|nr:hypothetical protein E2562_019225 [Oryza meyeriana var. granulata]KAF0933752.1 hypothetical protein E2562_019225 [Oryza meyeriana var. granulata]KAF0933753.1 hypothetical protein E2562_019225 [Oryza meyeriana var. granulata]KAF0933754.1 hypothetical protein E2562_019225 [Oryza meyeriana var. granulata]KAF0933755.1 hypothetical protein E2562_019225 [Oryza meyeriana var. granulata]